MTPAPPAHLSELTLQSLRLGALSGETLARTEQHLIGCERCSAQLRTLDGFAAAFATEVFPRTVENVTRRIPGPGAFGRWWFAPASGLALTAAVFALWVLPAAEDRAPPSGPPAAIRTKGKPGFRTIAARGAEVFPVENGRSVLRPGDRIRFVLRPAGLPYALVAAVDGGGAVTIYHPFGGRQSAPVAPGAAEVSLPGSIRLDDAPGPERIFVLQSRQPLAAPAVEQALAELARRGAVAIRTTDFVDLPAEAQSSLLFEKTPPTDTPSRSRSD